MSAYPLFLSLVYVVRNDRDRLAGLLEQATQALQGLVTDYEIVVVDNGSDDDSIDVLKRLTTEEGLPNLQVFALTREVDLDTASCAGIENALGDFVAVMDPLQHDIGFLGSMLERATRGCDIVFAANQHRAAQRLAYRSAYRVLAGLYKLVTGIHLEREAPQYRVLSRRVANFILQHAQPAIVYRHLLSARGFVRELLEYRSAPTGRRAKHLGDSIDRGMQLLVSTGRAPMRLVTSLSLFGAFANLLYSIYVLVIAAVKPDVAPGWVSLSLQQSGMFFLISLVLLVLGEYVLQMAGLSNGGPLYHVGQEFTSARLSRRERLNVEEVVSAHSGILPRTPLPVDE